MEKYVITITRQFGSMGRPIAKLVSDRLKIPYYDRDIVEAAAKRLDLPLSFVSNEEESVRSPFWKMRFPLGKGTSDIQDRIFNVQKNMIYDIASRETCVIVGRCSDYILQDMKNHIGIYIYAPYEERLKNCIDKLGIEAGKAEETIAMVDLARELYHKRFAHYLPNDTDYKKLLIDSSLLGVEGTAGLIADMINEKFGN